MLKFRLFYNALEQFYHITIRENPNTKIDNFIQHPEWRKIQQLANTLLEVEG